MELDIASIIQPKLAGWQITGQNFAKTRFLVNADEFGANDAEREELMNIADGITCSVQSDGKSVSLHIEYGQSPYLDIVQNGMPAPVTHGGGEITLPSGETEPSNAATSGVELPWYSKTGEDVMGEVATMLQQLFRDAVMDAVRESRSEIADAAKTYLIPHLQLALGGVS